MLTSQQIDLNTDDNVRSSLRRSIKRNNNMTELADGTLNQIISMSSYSENVGKKSISTLSERNVESVDLAAKHDML